MAKSAPVPSFESYAAKMDTWRAALKPSEAHSVWGQIYSMLIDDLSFRSIAAGADADRESALHTPLIYRSIVHGYAARQALFVRRLVDDDKKVISLRRIVVEMKSHQSAVTREHFVRYGASLDGGPSEFSCQHRFDSLAELKGQPRSDGDVLSGRLIKDLERRLMSRDITDTVKWGNTKAFHLKDPSKHNEAEMRVSPPTFRQIASAQKSIVQCAEFIGSWLLHLPIHGEIVPVMQFNQFVKMEQILSEEALALCKRTWNELAKERAGWTNHLANEFGIEI